MAVFAPVFFKDDFLGQAFDSVNVWSARETGSGAAAIVASAANGVLGLALDATNEAQLAGVDWGDNKTLVLEQGLVIEIRFRLSVLPTGSVVAVVGLASSHNAAVDSVATSAWFRVDGGGVIKIETDDGTNETSKVATGVTLEAGTWVIGRIDCTNPDDVRFYLDGDAVGTDTGFDMSTTPSVALQPVARIGKESAATSVGTLEIDYIKAWQKRS